jgi:hypothetical protein
MLRADIIVKIMRKKKMETGMIDGKHSKKKNSSIYCNVLI